MGLTVDVHRNDHNILSINGVGKLPSRHRAASPADDLRINYIHSHDLTCGHGAIGGVVLRTFGVGSKSNRILDHVNRRFVIDVANDSVQSRSEASLKGALIDGFSTPAVSR